MNLRTELLPPPSVAVEDEPDTQAKHGDHRGYEEERPDHAQVADESGDRIALAAAENLGREDADREEAADPDHRGEDMQEHQPVVQGGGDWHQAACRCSSSPGAALFASWCSARTDGSSRAGTSAAAISAPRPRRWCRRH